MTSTQESAGSRLHLLPKAPTGIAGLDEITGGGLPRGRAALVCGGAGSGKTLFAVEFLVRGATEYGEPGVFLSFEETGEELTQNVASLGFDLDRLVEQGLLSVDYVRVERSEIEETGEYDLEGLFIRLGFAIDSIGAKRVVLDTLEALFGGLQNEGILRAEIRRLFRWLKDKGVTAVITAERGQDNELTRHGLEEYVSDCVILLDHRIVEQVSTRRLRVIKYRGSRHGTNEYPFLIGDTGFTVMPITSMGLNHNAPEERISTGIPRLDEMLEGKGYFVGSTILLSGTAGTGKTSIATTFARAACESGRRCLYFSFEESPAQIVRNMRSIGIDLGPYVEQGLLRFHSMRPTSGGLETHLAMMHQYINDFAPSAIVVDPITDFIAIGSRQDVKAMISRLIDYLKQSGITSLLTSLTSGGSPMEGTEAGISSLVDTWLLVRGVETSGERNRVLYVLKSRGMAHSNQVREFLLTSNGVELLGPYLGPSGVLTGSSRLAEEAKMRAEEVRRRDEVEGKQRQIAQRHRSLQAQLAALQADIEAVEAEARRLEADEQAYEERTAGSLLAMARSRAASAQASAAPTAPAVSSTGDGQAKEEAGE